MSNTIDVQSVQTRSNKTYSYNTIFVTNFNLLFQNLLHCIINRIMREYYDA